MKNKMRVGFIAAIMLFGYYTCLSQNNSLPIKLFIKVDKEYERTWSKKIFKERIRRNQYVVKSDSIKQKWFDITIDIKNTSTDTIGIWLMTCSWENNFIVNNDYILVDGHDCDSNFPRLIKINPGESKSYQNRLAKSIKFDYPCEYCVYGPQVVTTKIGLIIIDDVFKHNLGMLDYNVAMNDKSIQQIVWSNSLYLLGKQPEPQIIPIIKKK